MQGVPRRVVVKERVETDWHALIDRGARPPTYRVCGCWIDCRQYQSRDVILHFDEDPIAVLVFTPAT